MKAINIYYWIPADFTFPINVPDISSFTRITSPVDGLVGLQLRAKRNDDGRISKLVSNELKFYDFGYNLLYDQLVVQRKEAIFFKLTWGCCGNYEIITAIVRRDEIEFCTKDCFITAQLIQADDDTMVRDQLDNTLIWDDDFVINYDAPNVTVLNAASPRIDRRKWEYAIPSVYLRDYFINSCNKLGLSFDSTIFEYNGLNSWTGDNYDYDPNNATAWGAPVPNPYYYAAVVFQAYLLGEDLASKYRAPADSIPKKLSDQHHVLNWNVNQYLTEMSAIFNAQWRIKNGVLKFERKDYFFLDAPIWLDLSKENVCFKLDQFRNQAYLRLEFPLTQSCQDIDVNVLPVNIPTVEVFSTVDDAASRYKSINEWNSPPTLIQRGELSRVFETFEGWATLGNDFQAGEDMFLLLREFYTEKPILLSLREDSPQHNKQVAVLPSSNVPGPTFAAGLPNNVFNTYRQNPLNDRLGYKNLYESFHFIDNPRNDPNNQGYLSKYLPKNLTFEVITSFTCDDLQNFDVESAILTSEGKGLIDDITFDFYSGNVTILGQL